MATTPTGKHPVQVEIAKPKESKPEEPVDSKKPKEEKDEEKLEEATVENSWNMPDDNVVIKNIYGVETHIELINGEEYTELSDKCTDVDVESRKVSINKSKYMKLLITRCVKKPEFIYSKLKPNIILELVAAIETHLGMSEVAQKNLEWR